MSESTRPSKIAYTAFDPLRESLPSYVLVGQRPSRKDTTQTAIGQIVANSQYNIRLKQMQFRGNTDHVARSSIELDQEALRQLRDDLDKVIAWMAEPFPEEFDELLIPEDFPKLKSLYTEDGVKMLIRGTLSKFNIPDLTPIIDTLFLKLKNADALSLVGD